ncbi:serine/threonine-protein kinase [Kiritimatiellaeota bacterium B1221]|nr:serine/threonine-protein kinase [Kiritimatiellaeota bacterium B1221]
MSDDVNGMNLGGYQIVGRLGRGAMADVYDAVDSTGHEVALKVFKAGGGMSYTMLERFRREAEATKILRRHPYILTVYASGHEGDYHYIAMEKVADSRSLDTFMHRGPDKKELLKIIIKLAEALQYSHDNQIIHRDVKPSNVLLDEFNEPMLTDFGVAELTDWPSLTLSGALTGTPLYMAPEQARSEEATPSSDVYSLGVLLFEGLTGRLPYELDEAASTSSILEAVKNQQIKGPRQLDKKISKDLNYVVMKALRKSPAERYSSAREFAGDLQLVLEDKPVTARWASPWTRGRFWMRKHRTALAGAGAFFLLAASGWVLFREQVREQTYRDLMSKAREVNKDYLLSWLTDNRGAPEMKSAMNAMQRGRWIEARDMLQRAVNINEGQNQMLSLAESRMQLARVEVMLHNSVRALDLYQSIWENEELPPHRRQQAGFEGAILLLLDDDDQIAHAVLHELERSPDGPYLYLIRYMTGLPRPEDWDALTAGWLPGLQRSLFLAEMIRNRNIESREGLRTELDVYLRGVDPEEKYDWPLPYGEYIRGRL